jgi:hypothetical protein
MADSFDFRTFTDKEYAALRANRAADPLSGRGDRFERFLRDCNAALRCFASRPLGDVQTRGATREWLMEEQAKEWIDLVLCALPASLRRDIASFTYLRDQTPCALVITAAAPAPAPAEDDDSPAGLCAPRTGDAYAARRAAAVRKAGVASRAYAAISKAERDLDRVLFAHAFDELIDQFECREPAHDVITAPLREAVHLATAQKWLATAHAALPAEMRADILSMSCERSACGMRLVLVVAHPTDAPAPAGK